MSDFTQKELADAIEAGIRGLDEEYRISITKRITDSLVDIVSAKIPYGHENAINRFRLSQELHMSDRKVRELISKANKQGANIINLGDGKGYFKVSENELDEISEVYWREYARIESIKESVDKFRDLLLAAGRTV